MPMATVNSVLRKRGILGRKYPIVVRIIQNRKMAERRVQDYMIIEKDWDERNQRVRASHPRAARINMEIKKVKRKYEDAYDDLVAEGKTLISLKDVLTAAETEVEAKKKELTFSKYLSDYLNINPDELSHNTLDYYRTTLMRWDEFLPKKLLTDVTEKDVINFRKYLKSKKNKQNTVYNRMKTVRKMCHKARREGLLMRNPFENVTLKQAKSHREYLTIDELNEVLRLKLTIPIEILTRDVFCFGCLTGLRFGDICRLRNSDIRKEGMRYRLLMTMGKTKNQVSFLLNEAAVNIAQKYWSFQERNDYIFPLINGTPVGSEADEKKRIGSKNAYLNKMLKDVIKKTSIKKHITMHIGRHTHATLSLMLGADIYVLSKVLGHTDVQVTQLYAQVVDQKKDELTGMWDNQFKSCG